MTDRVPCGTSVTAAYYRDWMQTLRRIMHKTDLTCSGMGHSFCTTMHARTQEFVTDLLSTKYEWEVLPHAPYSPDMSPPDFDLFHNLKEPLRGHRFPSLEEVSAAVTRTIRGLNKSGTLNGMANLPKRWDAAIEKRGDYIEGV
jgi:hypothetical protein